MKIVKQVPAYLLALVFLVFGLNYWFKYIPMPELSGDQKTYLDVLFTTGYLQIIKIMEVVFALLLLIPKTRALGYLLMAPITVGILFFEIYIAKSVSIGAVLVLLNALGIYFNKEKYMSVIN